MTPEQELEQLKRQRDLVHEMLNKLFGWGDEGWLHAVLHVEDAVLNLKTDLKVERQMRELAEAERDEVRKTLQLVWEEGNDPERCDLSDGHLFSQPCRDAVQKYVEDE